MPRQGSGVDAKRRCGELRWKSSRKGQEGMGRIECRLRMGDERLLRTRDEHEKGKGKTAPGEEFPEAVPALRALHPPSKSWFARRLGWLFGPLACFEGCSCRHDGLQKVYTQECD